MLGKVTGVADAPGAKGVATFLEVGVRVGADLSTVVVDHVDGFILSHSWFRVLRSATGLEPEQGMPAGKADTGLNNSGIKCRVN